MEQVLSASLAAAPQQSFWSLAPGNTLTAVLIGCFIAGILIMVGLTFAPTRARRPIVLGFTFLSGLFFVVYWLYPVPINIQEGTGPRTDVFGESFGFWLRDSLPTVSTFAQVIAAFLLGLGIYSLLRVHSLKVIKLQKDWFFSAILLLSLIAMVAFGYWDYNLRLQDQQNLLDTMENWQFANYGYNLLFIGLFQQMEAAMFSIIAFFILSAAYRAFRIRSVEATILMASALIVMISLMAAVDSWWSSTVVNAITGGNEAHIGNNLALNEISQWIRANLQIPSIRALDFGVALGALAMALRIWLGLERGGVSN